MFCLRHASVLHPVALCKLPLLSYSNFSRHCNPYTGSITGDACGSGVGVMLPNWTWPSATITLPTSSGPWKESARGSTPAPALLYAVSCFHFFRTGASGNLAHRQHRSESSYLGSRWERLGSFYLVVCSAHVPQKAPHGLLDSVFGARLVLPLERTGPFALQLRERAPGPAARSLTKTTTQSKKCDWRPLRSH